MNGKRFSTLAAGASMLALSLLAGCGGGGGGSGDMGSGFVASAGAASTNTNSNAAPTTTNPNMTAKPDTSTVSKAATDVATAATDGTQKPSNPMLRQTRFGGVIGIDQSSSAGTQAWLGVPYAKPPVGALRWMPPVDPEPWGTPRDASRFGASCIQGGRFFSPAPDNAPFGRSVRDAIGQPVGSEDCLTLNIWRPATTQTKLPVIVFIHGGSNISGYSADPIYDGRVLAQKAQAVVVTINYRLGLFGWLDLAQLKTGDPLVDSGNFGTLDQVQALRFVQGDIAAFGGDPGNVTVMGQSAGAVNVWALLVSPLTAGLMHKAVPLSGGLVFANKPQAQAFSNALVTSALLADGKASNNLGASLWLATQNAADVAAYLRGKSADDLTRLTLAEPALPSAPAVIPDGAVVPLLPQAAILAGHYRKVPLIAGNTREEGKLFGGVVGAYVPDDKTRFTMQYDFDPDAPPTLTEADLLKPAFLPVDKPVLGWNTVAAALTTSVFTTGAVEALGLLAITQPAQTWYYSFDWKQEAKPFDTVYGAAHAMDLPFMFGNFGKSVFSFGFSQANRPGREALSDAMIASLAAFVRTGNPNTPSLGTNWPNWPGRVVFDATYQQARITN